MSTVECPYCGAAVEVCQDDGHATDESETYEQECHYCKKVFALSAYIHWHFKGRQADCMNGGAHDLEDMQYSIPWFVGFKYCKGCCNKILIDKDANQKAMEDYAKQKGET